MTQAPERSEVEKATKTVSLTSEEARSALAALGLLVYGLVWDVDR